MIHIFSFFFFQLVTKAAASDTELKAKHVREILKLTTKFINEAKKTEEVRAPFEFFSDTSLLWTVLYYQ